MPRAVSPVFGTVLLLSLTVLTATAIATTSLGMTPVVPLEPVVISGTADASTGRITLTHESGPDLDFTRIRVRIAIDGEPLAHQPPARFFSADGFHSGPTGPFNTATDPEWTLGETASLAIAGTNEPQLAPGSSVEVVLSRNGRTLVSVTFEATAG